MIFKHNTTKEMVKTFLSVIEKRVENSNKNKFFRKVKLESVL